MESSSILDKIRESADYVKQNAKDVKVNQENLLQFVKNMEFGMFSLDMN